MEKAQSPVRVACIQMDVAQNNVPQNLATAERLVGNACGTGAKLLVLPELFNTGCALQNREDAYRNAEPVPGGRTTDLLVRLAEEKQAYITGSIVEREGNDLYNTAVLAGPEGYIGKYRKLHPCEDEVYWFEPGNLGIPVFRTPIGRIALLICLDGYYPETYRICALQGADIICMPSNWSDVKESRGLPDPYRSMAPTLCMANALSNHIFVAATNRVGQQGPTKYAGQSVIANQWGAPIAGPAGIGEEILCVDIDLCDTRRRYFHPTNARLANRRTDVYSADLGYCPEKYSQV